MNATHHIFHGWLPVGGADDGVATSDDGVDLTWSNFGWAASESGVGWEKSGGEGGELVGHMCAFWAERKFCRVIVTSGLLNL